jgi:class 3 adenylate cyclase
MALAEPPDLEGVLNAADDHVVAELKTTPDIINVGHDLDLTKASIQARKWLKVEDAVAVVVDLKNSSQLGLNKWAASTASIYEAAIKPVVDIFVAFGADDIDIQGDGVFALFWGDKRTERALSAGVTIKTFSEKHLVERLNKRWDTLPETGFKVGIAASALLVKRIGVARTDHQEEVWPGRAVNYATKAAQVADAHELIVTETVWKRIEGNHYLTHTCGCPDGLSCQKLWSEVTIEKLRWDEHDRNGRRLRSIWCDVHGPEFCDAILEGQTKREEIQQLLRQGFISQSLAAKRKRDAERRRSMALLRAAR